MSGIRYQVTVLGAVAALGFALFMQHFMGLKPCELCIWQRKVYGVVILFSLLVLVLKTHDAKGEVLLGKSMLRSFAKLVVAVALAAEVGIAVYHAGIELHWWQGFQNCSSALKGGQSIEQIRAQIMNTPLVRCDEPQWYLAGLTMAAWNAVYAFGLFLISVIPCRKST